MSQTSQNSFESFLSEFDDADWKQSVSDLLPAIHEVDRNAVQIWFAFFPFELARTLRDADDPTKLAARLLMKGNYRLQDQIDTSHEFFYGHRFWQMVKRAITEHAAKEDFSQTLQAQIAMTAQRAATEAKQPDNLLVAITAVAFATVAHVGLAAFNNASGEAKQPRGRLAKSPDEILRARTRDDSQGMLGFLRTTDKRFTVTFDENDRDATFKIMNAQELASGAADDRRDYTARDERRLDGPIPVECRSAACGTCWVGVISGAETLSPVQRREREQMRVFGYTNTDEEKPLIRLACQAQGFGNQTIAIPTWNGSFGKTLRQMKEGTYIQPNLADPNAAVSDQTENEAST